MENVLIVFDDHRLLPQLFGKDDRNLLRIESELGVMLSSRGNKLSVSGKPEAVEISEHVLRTLYDRLAGGQEVGEREVDAAIRLVRDAPGEDTPEYGNGATRVLKPHGRSKRAKQAVIVKTPRRQVMAYTQRQAEYIDALQGRDIVFAAGPAGTGKTYLAVCAAVAMFAEGRIERIILSRPAVEAGERLGFLPGDLREKVDPYLRPLYDALHDTLPPEKVVKYAESGQIEVAPLAFMRGRTLRNAFVILDEAQNTTPVQMKMFLTRLGEGSRMAVTGDLSQIDLPSGTRSGFHDALEKLKDVKEIGVVRFRSEDVVRHPLTVKIVQAYEQAESRKK